MYKKKKKRLIYLLFVLYYFFSYKEILIELFLNLNLFKIVCFSLYFGVVSIQFHKLKLLLLPVTNKKK